MWADALFRLNPRRRPRVPAGTRIYAIGDIHGRPDLFLGLIGKIETDNVLRGPGAYARLIVLGDFIDRGPGSAKMLRMLQTCQALRYRLDVLLGNHEWMLLRAVLGEEAAQAEWMAWGGDAFCASYGIAPPEPGEAWEFGQRVGEAVGLEAIEWLRGLRPSVRYGDYFFCHAGVKPGVPLHRQTDETLLTMRDEFMTYRGGFGAVIVHGHNRVDAVEIHPNRISLDTGAYETGLLSAIGLEGDDSWIVDYGLP